MNGHKGRSPYFVDSNIFLRVFVRDEERTWQDCVDVLKAIRERRIVAYIPVVVAAEVQFVLASFYGFQKRQILDAIKSLTAIPNLQFHDDCSLPLAIELFETHNVKFIDSLLASSKRIQEGNAAILSYDRDFDKLGVRRVEPRDLLKKSLKK